MLPDVTLPASLSALLAVFAPCFTAPSFRPFCALACGFVGQTGKRTVCGMLTGAGLLPRLTSPSAGTCALTASRLATYYQASAS